METGLPRLRKCVLDPLQASVLAPTTVEDFADRLALFKAGYSWGGVTALAMTYPTLNRPGKDYAGRIVRLNVGLEEPGDLIADLDAALSPMTLKSPRIV